MRLRSIAVFASVAALGITQASIVAASNKGTDHKITICHRTNSMSNPYVQITVDKASADGQGGKGDHYANHTGTVWTSDSAKGTWGDIIPPIEGVHNGRNWTLEGQAIWNNDCQPLKAPAVTPPAAEIPEDEKPNADFDEDGIPNVTDTDDDGDGTPDAQDSNDYKAPADNDGDGIPNTTDTDDDGDGVADVTDSDEDGDGVPDVIDSDDNDDGVTDEDAPDQDKDGVPDVVDTDDDGDGTPDRTDSDLDNDGTPNNQDRDDDGDKVPDSKDPSNPSTEVLVVPDGRTGDYKVDTDRPAGTGPAMVSVRIRCAKGGKPAAAACDAKLVGKTVRVSASCVAGPVAKLIVTTRANNARPSTVTKTIKLGKRKASAAGEVRPQACRA